MEVLRGTVRHLPRTAVVAGGRSYRYSELLSSALTVCRRLEGQGGPAPPLPGAATIGGQQQQQRFGEGGGGGGAGEPPPRVALMCDPGPAYVSGSLAAWLHGGIAVPLCLSHPDRELSYVLEDAEVSSLLVSECHAERMHALARPLGVEVHAVEEPPPAAAQQQQKEEEERAADALLRREVEARVAGLSPEAGALIIYTSGTTGRPKGALHTHASLAAQVGTLCRAWEWEQSDRILHTLPLHHIHGILNALLCPLSTGACVEVLPKFSPSEVWSRLQRPSDRVSVFMGVPTMYSYLLSRYDDMAPAQQQAAADATRQLRLTVSGSAACPQPIMARWEELSGQRLLERYGMTETGMLLGNPYRGKRRPGSVGLPFPGVDARLALADGSDAGEGPGELRVRTPHLFREYWRRPEATAEAFDEQGYFMTGDTAVVEAGGYYRLLGRTSVDIIKHGGYKISALQIESTLLEHPDIAEAAVFGVPDEAQGERIVAVVALKQQQQQQQQQQQGAADGSGGSGGDSDGPLTLKQLRGWGRERLPPYQLPGELRLVAAIPRNAMGKVNKKELRSQLFPAPPPPPPPAAAAAPAAAATAA